MGKKVELNTLMKLFAIFVKKQWTIIDGYDDVLNRFGELVDVLEQDEIELIIDLTEKYQWLTYNEYHTSLRTLLKQLATHSLVNKKRVYIFPVIKPTDEHKIKSGHAVMYMLGSIKSSLDEYKNIEFIQLKEFKDLKEGKLILNSDDFLILVDDYIGSGKTLSSTLLQIDNNKSIKNNYAILTVAMQEDAKNQLKNAGIKYYNSLSLSKGISNHYNSPELEKRLKTMTKIENRIPKVTKYRHGYEKSEALITLMKTPNNTFPIFWKGFSHKGIEISAPFQRY
jgi:hypothetical protein